jgi:hypothetical protein
MTERISTFEPNPLGWRKVFRLGFTEDRGEGAEKSAGFHKAFVKEVSFRKGITFYTFLNSASKTD